MEFRTYLEIRHLFNSKKESLSTEQFQVMIKALGHFHTLSVSGNEKDLIDDLIDDIEVWIDQEDTGPVTAIKNEGGKNITHNVISFISPSVSVIVTVLDYNNNDLAYECELEIIRQALLNTGGNRTMASKQLGLSIRTLRNKINEYRQKGRIIEYDLSRVC